MKVLKQWTGKDATDLYRDKFGGESKATIDRIELVELPSLDGLCAYFVYDRESKKESKAA